MHNYTFTLTNDVQNKVNPIFLSDMPESMVVDFEWDETTNISRITNISFPDNHGLSNSVRGEIITKYLNKNINQIIFPQYNRRGFFQEAIDPMTKLQYRFMDTSQHIANEYISGLKQNNIIYYKSDSDLKSVTAYVKEQGPLLEDPDEGDMNIDNSLLEIKNLSAIKVIGNLSAVDTEEGLTWLDDVEVDEAYRRRGVATEMMRVAIGSIGLNAIPCVTNADAYQFCLTSDGEKLVVGCIGKNIITPTICYFSTISDRQHSYDILEPDNDELDPGYDSQDIVAALLGDQEAPHPH